MFSVALTAALAGLLGYSQAATAGVTIDLIFRASGTDTITLTAGGGGPTTIMDVIVTTDQDIVAGGVSVDFDRDGGNELNIGSAAVWFGQKISMGVVIAPLAGGSAGVGTQDESNGTFGTLRNFYGIVTNPNTAPPSTWNMGTVVWSPNAANVTNDGADIFATMAMGLDVWGDANSLAITNVVLRTATVNIVPEPGTASLLGLGLMGLILAGRRSRA